MDTPILVGDIVVQWLRLNPQRLRTIVYAVNVAHAIHLCEEFVRAGVRAAHIDAKTQKEERDETLKKLSSGDIEVVCNCMVLTEGLDVPELGCIVLARPTKHMGLYRQMVGRGLRPFPGKDHVIVIDHSGATFRHGFVEDPVNWTLHEDERADAPAHQARIAKGAAPAIALVACTKCSAIRSAGKPCPECGHMPKRPGQDIDVLDADLHRLDRNGRLNPADYTEDQRIEFHRMLTHIGAARGYKPGWAAHKFKERFSQWPPRHGLPPLEPNPEVHAWERYTRIRYAKAMQKQVAAHG